MKCIPNILILAGAVITFQSFTLPNWEVSEILQAVVDLEPMEEVWNKEKQADLPSIYLLAHDHFPEMPDITVKGRKVKVMTSKEAATPGAGVAYMDFTKFKIKKGKKARLEFTYEGIQVKAVMVKQEGVWKHRSLSISGKGIHHKSLDWTF